MFGEAGEGGSIKPIYQILMEWKEHNWTKQDWEV